MNSCSLVQHKIYFEVVKMEGRGGRKRRLVQIWRQTQEGKRVLCRTLDMTQERDASCPSSGCNNAAILAENWPTHAREPSTAVNDAC